MKIKSIEAFAIDLKPNIKTKPRVPKSKDPYDTRGMVSPMNLVFLDLNGVQDGKGQLVL